MPEGRLIRRRSITPQEALREYLQPNLESLRYGLSDRPDRLMETFDRRWVPVDVKNKCSSRSGKPLDSHVAQLAVYCLLVEDLYQPPVTHGVIEYKDGPVTVAFDNQLRDWIIGVVRTMQQAKQQGLVPNRNHTHRQRCAQCSYRPSWSQALS